MKTHRKTTQSVSSLVLNEQSALSSRLFNELPEGVKKSYVILEHKQDKIEKRLLRISRLGQRMRELRSSN
jgi:hypothetical protein